MISRGPFIAAVETIVFMMILPTLIAGCASTINRPLARDPEGIAQIDHGYALLDSLLSDESSVADILVIKSVRDDVGRLLERISKLAKADRAALQNLYPLSPGVDPSKDGLPRIEEDARARIRNQQTGLLLMSGGEEFEVLILLTQEKATDYAEALCRSLADADPRADRRKALEGMAEGWREMNRRARSLFTLKPQPRVGKD